LVGVEAGELDSAQQPAEGCGTVFGGQLGALVGGEVTGVDELVECQVPGLVEAGLSPADALPDGVVGVVERLVLSGWDEAEFAV
jgi:hypothetical protein